MNRGAFEAWMRREYGDISLDRTGTGEYREWFVWRTWQAWRVATNSALEEAAEVCERIGPAMAERYGPGAECITTSDECAEAIRALKEKK